MTGVDASQFSLATTGNITGASIASVTEIAGSNGTQYTVAVDTGTGDGTIALEIMGAWIHDLAGNGLPGGVQAQQTYATGSFPNFVTIADVNGDGKSDLLLSNYYSNDVSVLLGNGDGTFQAQQTYATGAGPSASSAADVNGDGKPDLLVADIGSSTVSVLLGNGDGTFQTQQTYADRQLSHTGSRPPM